MLFIIFLIIILIYGIGFYYNQKRVQKFKNNNYLKLSLALIIIQVIAIAGGSLDTLFVFPSSTIDNKFIAYSGFVTYYLGYFLISIIAILITYIPIFKKKKQANEMVISKDDTIARNAVKSKETHKDVSDNKSENIKIDNNVSDSNCLTQKRKNKHNPNFIALIICLAILSCTTICLLINGYELNSDIKSKDLEISNLKSQNEKNSELLSSYILKYANLMKKSDFYDEFIVFVSDNTKVYHKYGCQYLDLTSFLAFNIDNAKEQGYKPCSHCIK